MGIEIVGFSWASHVARRHSDRRCELDEHYVVGPECKLLDGYKPGCYEPGVRFDFYVSYAAFDTWQQALSLVVLGVPASEVVENESRFAGQPFVELIAFPYGNDVGIGPITSAKLYRDCVKNSTKVKAGFQQLANQAAKRSRKERTRPARKKSRTATIAEALAEALGGTALGGDADPNASCWEWKWKLYRDFRKAFKLAKDDGLVILSI
jgi:hypothetical protein